MRCCLNFLRLFIVVVYVSDSLLRMYFTDLPLAHRNIEAMEVRRRLQRSSRVVVVKMESKKPSCLERIHAVFTFLIPLLMGLLQVDYQTKKVSPLDTHPINIRIFFAATFLYCLGQSLKTELQIHQPNYSQFINHAILSLGSLSAVSLASIFLPRVLGWFCLGLWTVLPIMLARHFIKQIYENLKKRIMKKFNQFRGAHIEESEPL